MFVSNAKCLAGAVIASFFVTSCTSGPTTPLTSLGYQQKASHLRSHQTGCPCIYVAENLNNSVAVYATGASGNATPLQYIRGTRTKLNTVFDVAVDPNTGNIYVANEGNSSVTVYAAGATGNVKPVQTIIGASTGLDFPYGIALGPGSSPSIYVANHSANSITIYASSAKGDAAPTSTISGSSTGLNGPAGLAVDASGNVYVPNVNTDTITVYAAGSINPGANNISPMATITSTSTCKFNKGTIGPSINQPYQVALDSESNIYVANSNGPYCIAVFAPDASGSAKPIRTITGMATKLSSPDGVALDAGGNVYVANTDTHHITVYPPAEIHNVKPIQTLGGRKLIQPDAIAVQ
jgi:DNA-binding beta-propeller fold protein YncE